MMRPRVLIAGGGIGGLTAALALLKSGCDVEVYEQAAELKEVGAGLELAANGTRVLHELGIGEQLKPLACVATGKEVRLWSSGETWKLFDLGAVSIERYGYPYLTVYRPDLLRVLAAAVQREKPDAIHLGAKCSAVSQDGKGVRLRLADGTEAGGDALIGADGVHSRIRQALFGPDRPSFTGIVAWRGVIPIDRLPERMARSVGTNWIGPGGHVVHYPVRAGSLMNFVGALERADWQVESWSTRGTTGEMAADFAGWNEDVQTMIRNIETPYKWALMVRPPMERWTLGRASLLGDACHSMVPLLAQGANMAIEDGFVLARCLKEHRDDLPVALMRYENARLDRTRRAVEGSAANIQRFHNPKLSEGIGQPVVVENRPGAGGTVGSTAVARAPADGYTLLYGSTSTLAIAPSLYRDLAYDPRTAFAPISLVSRGSIIAAVNAQLPAKTLKDFIALAKSSPGRINYGSAGSGTPPHLAAELFKTVAGVDLVNVPYKGGGPAVSDLAGGQVQVIFEGLPTLLPHIKSGKVRALAITGAKRDPALPEVPTFAEAGLPGYDANFWNGLVAPAGTPAAG